MDLFADILLAIAAVGAGVYCHVLSRRLSRLNDLEKGVGGAVAHLATQVDALNSALNTAQSTAKTSVGQLNDVNGRAEAAAKRLELLLASMHDLDKPSRVKSPFFERGAIS